MGWGEKRKYVNWLSRPLNTSATPHDIAHILKITKPTHIATIEDKLGAVQEALASLPNTNIKVMTVRCKVEGLPQVSRIIPRGYHISVLTML